MHDKLKTIKTIIPVFISNEDIQKIYKIRNKNEIFKNSINEKKRKQFEYTLKYMFFKIGQGIFIKIKNNKLIQFNPFYNINYKNNWHHLIKFKNAESFKDYLKNKKPDDYKYDMSTWNANGCLLNHWNVRDINDGRWAEIYDMFNELASNKKIKDCEFFVNYKDFPVARYNNYESNFFLFDNMQQKMKDFKSNNLLPIFSIYGSKIYRDILIPSYSEWKVISKKYFASSGLNSCENKQVNIKKKKWEDKIATAIFRGSATGCGITNESNQRLKIAYLSKQWITDNNYNENNNIDKVKFLNAGITGFNRRDKKDYNKLVDQIYTKKFDKVGYMSKDDMQIYKYVVYIDGHVAAERLINELDSGSVILKVESLYGWTQWFHVLLKPMVHYVPVKKDLSDLGEQIKWCKLNDEKCREIVKNAEELFKKITSKKYIFDYLEQCLNNTTMSSIKIHRNIIKNVKLKKQIKKKKDKKR